MLINEVKALVFDVFGTVVDWRMSIAREGKELAKRKDITGVDWPEFADAWRSGYGPSMNKVRTGELPWTRIDDLHRMILDELLVKYGIEGLSEDEKRDFNKAWHRLDAWPDSPPGLTRLKKRYVIATLSNGNVALLTNMAKWAGLPWGLHPLRRTRPPLQARPRDLSHGRRHTRPRTRRGDDDRSPQGRPQGRAGPGTQDRLRPPSARTRPPTRDRHLARGLD